MKFEDFKDCFFDEINVFVEVIIHGQAYYNSIIEDEPDFEQDETDFLKLISNSLQSLSVKCFLSDGIIDKHEIELFSKIDEFIEILTDEESGLVNRQRNNLSSDLLNNIMAENSGIWNRALKPLPLIYANIYDNNNGTNYSDRLARFYYNFLLICMKVDGNISNKESDLLSAFKTELFGDALFHNENNFEGMVEKVDNSKDINQLISELNGLVGIDAVKQEVQKLVNGIKINKAREERGLVSLNQTNHMVFYGNPGVGKTTVARLLASIFKELGILEKGHLVEVDRSGLVAGFVGQTAIKTNDAVRSAIGGVLFIDEAYSLTKQSDDYGSEAIDTLLKLMEDNRSNLVVIVAGYTEKMAEFINSNPGLKSRFTRYFDFPDYSPNELLVIFERMAEQCGMIISYEAKSKVSELIDRSFKSRDETFGNARLARNLLHDAISNQANRLVSLSEFDDTDLKTIEGSDIPNKVANI